jgi:hypothetical protein
MSDLAENAVAISAGFHSDKRYNKWLNELPASFGGFTGVWSNVALAATAFTEVETEIGEAVWDLSLIHI